MSGRWRIIFLLSVAVLAGCRARPTPAPAPTRTPAASPTAVAMATPVRPTASPRLAGWTEHRGADFALWLPESWTALEPGADGLTARFAGLQAQNPLLAGILGSADALHDAVFWAFGPTTPDAAFADNLNIRRASLGGQPAPDMAALIQPIIEQYRQLAFADIAAQTDLVIAGHAAAHITYSFPFTGRDGASGQITGHQYLVATDADLWILSYAAGPAADPGAAALFAQSAQTFVMR